MKEIKRKFSVVLRYISNPYRIWYEIIGFVEMVNRVFFWGWKMRRSWDFDANTIYEMLYLKYDRIYKCIEKHHHLVWNQNTETKGMKKLASMVLLTKRLSEDSYVDIADPTYWSDYYSKPRKIEDFFREDEKDKNRFRRAVIKSEEIKKQDKEMFLKLLQKNNDGWWD
jgi:hypothetical protein